MHAMEQIRVLVVEDHPVVRLGLKTMLESDAEIEVVGLAASGREALSQIGSCQPHVVLMDLRMPEMDGIEAITALRSERPEIEVVVLTNYHSDEDIFRAVRAGAMAYLLKSASLEEVLDAIRAVHAGERRLPPNIAGQLANHVARTPLSPREQEILTLVAKGLTNKQIGQVLFISDKTVRNHVISCLDKLQAKGRTEAIAIAIQRGLVRVSEM